MRMHSAVVSGLLIALPGLASAQTEFSGAQKCDVSKPQHEESLRFRDANRLAEIDDRGREAPRARRV
jgi:hypothetical protein